MSFYRHIQQIKSHETPSQALTQIKKKMSSCSKPSNNKNKSKWTQKSFELDSNLLYLYQNHQKNNDTNNNVNNDQDIKLVTDMLSVVTKRIEDLEINQTKLLVQNSLHLITLNDLSNNIKHSSQQQKSRQTKENLLENQDYIKKLVKDALDSEIEMIKTQNNEHVKQLQQITKNETNHEQNLDETINTLNSLSSKIELVKNIQDKWVILQEQQTVNESQDILEQIKNLMTGIESTTNQQDELKLALNMYSEQLSLVQVKLGDMENKFESFVSEYKPMIDRFDQKTSQLSSISLSESQNLASTVVNVKDQINNLETSMDSKISLAVLLVQIQINNLETSMNAQVPQIEEKISDIETSMDSKINTIQNQYDSLEISLESKISLAIPFAQSQIDNTNHNINKTILDMQTLADDTLVMKSDIQSLNDEVKKINENNVSVTETMENTKMAIKLIETKTKELSLVLESQQQQTPPFDSSDIVQNIEKLSTMYQKLEQYYHEMNNKFKSDFETLQKRYQQLHVIMISNVDENERGNNNVKELIELHQKIENEYKEMSLAYKNQYEDYKKSLQERDDKLTTLEKQIQSQIMSAENKMFDIENRPERESSITKTGSRINELAQPKFITPKKN